MRNVPTAGGAISVGADDVSLNHDEMLLTLRSYTVTFIPFLIIYHLKIQTNNGKYQYRWKHRKGY